MEILKTTSKKIQTVVVVDRNGLPIISYDTRMKKRIDPSQEMVIAGIAAAVLSLAESSSTVLNQGNLKELIIKKEKGSIIILDAGENAILIGILPPNIGYDAPVVSLKIIAGQIKKLQFSSNSMVPKPENGANILIPDID